MKRPTLSQHVTAYCMKRDPVEVMESADWAAERICIEEGRDGNSTPLERWQEAIWSLHAMYGPHVTWLCAKAMTLEELERQAKYGHHRILRNLEIGENKGIGGGRAVALHAKTIEEAREVLGSFMKLSDEYGRRGRAEPVLSVEVYRPEFDIETWHASIAPHWDAFVDSLPDDET